MFASNMSKGYITQIIGPVLDVVFPDGNLPKIYNAITDKTSLIININFIKITNIYSIKFIKTSHSTTLSHSRKYF